MISSRYEMMWLGYIVKANNRAMTGRGRNPFPADVCFAPLIQTHCIIHGYIDTASVGSWEGLWLDHVWCISSNRLFEAKQEVIARFYLKVADVIEEKWLLL